MPLRVPPGRAGRLWLLRRLETARRGREVLDQKRQTLLREQRRLAGEHERAAVAWEALAGEAAQWNDRALALAGERRLRLAAVHVEGRCEVDVAWRNALGTIFPTAVEVRPAVASHVVELGGGSTVAIAAQKHAEAVVAAADHAAARAAHDAITAELSATTRRLRAIEQRWIPEHEVVLARLELALDEREREDVARVRFALMARERDRPSRAEGVLSPELG